MFPIDKKIPFKFKAFNRNLLLVLWQNKWHQWTIHKRNTINDSRFRCDKWQLLLKFNRKENSRIMYYYIIDQPFLQSRSMDLKANDLGFIFDSNWQMLLNSRFDFAKCQLRGSNFSLKMRHKAVYNLINSRRKNRYTLYTFEFRMRCDLIQVQKETNWKSSNKEWTNERITGNLESRVCVCYPD